MRCSPDEAYKRLAAICYRERWSLELHKKGALVTLVVDTGITKHSTPFTAGHEGRAARTLLKRLPEAAT